MPILCQFYVKIALRNKKNCKIGREGHPYHKMAQCKQKQNLVGQQTTLCLSACYMFRDLPHQGPPSSAPPPIHACLNNRPKICEKTLSRAKSPSNTVGHFRQRGTPPPPEFIFFCLNILAESATLTLEIFHLISLHE